MMPRNVVMPQRSIVLIVPADAQHSEYDQRSSQWVRSRFVAALFTIFLETNKNENLKRYRDLVTQKNLWSSYLIYENKQCLQFLLQCTACLLCDKKVTTVYNVWILKLTHNSLKKVTFAVPILSFQWIANGQYIFLIMQTTNGTKPLVFHKLQHTHRLDESQNRIGVNQEQESLCPLPAIAVCI